MPAPKKPSSRARLLKTVVTAYLEPEQHRALKTLAKREQRPVQEFIREGIDLALARYKVKA